MFYINKNYVAILKKNMTEIYNIRDLDMIEIENAILAMEEAIIKDKSLSAAEKATLITVLTSFPVLLGSPPKKSTYETIIPKANN